MSRKIVLLVAALSVALATGCGADGGGESQSADATAKDVKDKRILYVPLWLDNSQTAVAHWLTEGWKKSGSEVTVINPDQSVGAQVNALQDGLASNRYDLIVWFPLDPRAQLSVARRIQDAGVPQVIQQQDLGTSSFSTPRVLIDPAKFAETLGNLGAQAVKKYFKTSAKVVWLAGLPDNPVCEQQLEGLRRGLKQVDPAATVVHEQGVEGSTQAGAVNVMTDLLTRGEVSFNMTMACGDTLALGIKQALEGAGRGEAVDKVPQTEVQVMADASPPVLQALWGADSSVLFSGLLPLKDEADAMVATGNELMAGELPLDSKKVTALGAVYVTPDCETGRKTVATNFEGVKGFKIPDCTFPYDVKWEVTE